MTGPNHPVRIAYLRSLQAILAIHLTRMDVDPELGGSPRFLDEIEENLNAARANLERLAVAERISLDGEEVHA